MRALLRPRTLTDSPLAQVPSSLPLTPLSAAFHTGLTLSRLLLLWELVLLGEPLLIFSADPRAGADLVAHLRNLIRPILFAGDERPYFHIHDIDFARIANSNQVSLGGVRRRSGARLMSAAFPAPAGTAAVDDEPARVADVQALAACLAPGLEVEWWPRGWAEEHAEEACHQGGRVAEGARQGVRRRRLSVPLSLASASTQQLTMPFPCRPDVGCDRILLQHIATLTERFLSPLNRYFGTLSTPNTTATILSSPLPAESFHPAEFLASLDTHGTPVRFRGAAPQARTRERFYLRFLGSPQFKSWLRDRTLAAGEVRRGRWLAELEAVDVEEWIGERGGRADSEVNELVGRLEREAVSEDAGRGGRLRQQATRLRQLQRENRLGVLDVAGGAGSALDSDSPGPSPIGSCGMK